MIIPVLTQATSPSFSKLNTGLGNALFQIFTAYGLCKSYNHTFNNYYIINLLVKLGNLSLDHKKTIYRNISSFQNINKHNIIRLREQHNYYSLYDDKLVENIKKFNDEKNIFIIGHFQSHIYFHKYYDEIKELIKPDTNSLQLIRKRYPHLFNENNINICIHTRLDWGHNISYNSKYYYEALEYLKNHLNTDKNIVLNIFSDNIKKAKNLFDFKTYENVVFFENNPDYIDYWCMTFCNHNIISHSTLSWWGAYMNLNKNKIVIYPEDLLRLVNATIFKDLKLIKRKKQHYKNEWVALKTKNVIYQ